MTREESTCVSRLSRMKLLTETDFADDWLVLTQDEFQTFIPQPNLREPHSRSNFLNGPNRFLLAEFLLHSKLDPRTSPDLNFSTFEQSIELFKTQSGSFGQEEITGGDDEEVEDRVNNLDHSRTSVKGTVFLRGGRGREKTNVVFIA